MSDKVIYEDVMVRTYIPKIVPEELERLKGNEPFLLRAELPRGARFLSINPVPSVIDMMGFSGGGGPPAFSYLVNPAEKETFEVVLMTVMPESPFMRPKDGEISMTPLGVVQCMGMLLAGFQLSGPNIAEVIGNFKGAGAYVFDTQPYTVPDMLKMLSAQNLSRVKAAASKLP